MTCVSDSQTLINLQGQAVKEVRRCLKLAEDYFDRKFVLDSVSFNLRGRSAGQFRVKQAVSRQVLRKTKRVKEIRLNALLLERYGEDFIRDTVGHEVAHFVVFELYSKRVRPHGKEWQAVMINVLNQSPSVTHQYETVPARKLPRYRYVCSCDSKVHELSIIRHKKVLSRKAKYHCKDCRTEIVIQD